MKNLSQLNSSGLVPVYGQEKELVTQPSIWNFLCQFHDLESSSLTLLTLASWLPQLILFDYLKLLNSD